MRLCDVVTEGVACRRPAIARVAGDIDATDDEPGDHWERAFCRDHAERARMFALALDVDWARIPLLAERL